MLSLSFLGYLLIYAALGTALLQGCIPLVGYWKKNIYLIALARPLALLQSFLVANAFLLLVSAFLSNDFSLYYVAQNSHPSLPFFYRLTAVWGAHEGSFLLWIFLLDLWTISVCFFSQSWTMALRSLSLTILGFISFCFLLFLNYTSNPFKMTNTAIPQDLNPLLQDPGFFIHPPMLYTGYVGFSIVFAITIAYLIRGEQDTPSWATIIRPWVLAAWAFLTIGITLGSWWAYHVLGWGGFWFWDPVENVSLLPWLTGAALLHLVIVVEKQQRFIDWAIVLAIISFSLSILGTFLVRSGILISVHSFANDPSRGLFLLLLLAVITSCALAIYIFRRIYSPLFFSTEQKQLWYWSSREGMLLTQTIFLFIAMATILLGTLYPLIIESLGLGTLSVGAPYFNHVLSPLLLLCLMVMGLAPFSPWQNKFSLFNKTSQRNILLSLTLAIILTLFFTWQWSTIAILGLTLIFWVLLSVSSSFFHHTAMTLAHSGFAIVIMSVILSSTFSKAREIQLHTGENVDIGPYVLHFMNIEAVQGKNFNSIRGNFTVWHNHHFITTLQPEKRIYLVRHTVMTKIDIYPAIFHDLYIALGEPSAEDHWSLRIYYKPFIRWVWLGGLCIALGGFLSLFSRMREKNNG